MNIICAALLAAGCLVIILGAIGIVRFPDFYSRLHPAGMIDTGGETLILLALILYEGLTPLSIKLLCITLFIHIANPTATHFLAKAANQSGLRHYRHDAKTADGSKVKKYEGEVA